MELKSFIEFFNEEYLALESIRHLDDHIFKPFLAGKFNMTDEQIKEWENKQQIIKEDKDSKKKSKDDEGTDDKKFLQNDEEVELIKKYQADPTSPEGLAARDKVVENKIPYIYSKVNKYVAGHPNAARDRDDMVQECLIALTTAIDKFKPESGNIFNAYVNTYISGIIMNHNNPARQKSIVDGKGNSYGENKVSVGSLDQTVGGDNGEWADKEQSLSDKIPDDNAHIPGEESEDDKSEHRAILRDWLNELPEDERKVVEMYFLVDSDKERPSMEDMGKQLSKSMSKMGVQKLMGRVLKKLRQKAEEAGFVDAPNKNADEFYEKLIRMAKGKSA